MCPLSTLLFEQIELSKCKLLTNQKDLRYKCNNKLLTASCFISRTNWNVIHVYRIGRADKFSVHVLCDQQYTWNKEKLGLNLHELSPTGARCHCVSQEKRVNSMSLILVGTIKISCFLFCFFRFSVQFSWKWHNCRRKYFTEKHWLS